MCGRTEKACNDHVCCVFIRENRQQTRRNRREYRQYGHEYYSGKLLETGEEVKEAKHAVNTEETTDRDSDSQHYTFYHTSFFLIHIKQK